MCSFSFDGSSRSANSVCAMNCTKDALRVKRVIEETRRFKKTQEDAKRFKKLQTNQRMGSKFKNLRKVSFFIGLSAH